MIFGMEAKKLSYCVDKLLDKRRHELCFCYISKTNSSDFIHIVDGR